MCVVVVQQIVDLVPVAEAGGHERADCAMNKEMVMMTMMN